MLTDYGLDVSLKLIDFGYKKKNLAEYLSITPQHLSLMLNGKICLNHKMQKKIDFFFETNGKNELLNEVKKTILKKRLNRKATIKEFELRKNKKYLPSKHAEEFIKFLLEEM